jgi:hypothetical protein
MPRSPTLEYALNRFHRFQTSTKGVQRQQLFYMILLFYPIIVLVLLFYLRPSFIMEDDYGYTYNNYKNYKNYNSYNKPKKSIDYGKLIVWFLFFQLPLLLHHLLPTSSEDSDASQ